MQHQQLAAGQWRRLPLTGQLANIGSEIGRAIKWKDQDLKTARQAALRAHELLWLTIEDPKNRQRLKEVTRLREVFNDYFYGTNQYKSTSTDFDRYFLALTIYSRNQRL
jgi:hypothetical protein